MKKNLTVLIASAALMLTSAVSMAQGGTTPLVGSTHNYTITPESTTNTLLWSVVEGSGYTINSQNVVTTTSVANITWTTAGTYHLRFSETNGTSCITLKEETVVVSANTFDVSASNPATVCNAATGQVNFSGSSATTHVTFKVDMTTGTTFNPNWEIKFTLTPGSGTPTLNNVVASQGTLTVNAGVYTLTSLTSSTTGPVNGTVDITLDVTGDIFTVLTTNLAITSAKELTYNTPDKDSNDWTATQTINDIPQTSTITTD
jgi:hypothetical protein